MIKEHLLNNGFTYDGVWTDIVKKISGDRLLGYCLKSKHVYLAQWTDCTGASCNRNFRDVFLAKCENIEQFASLYFAITGENLK